MSRRASQQRLRQRRLHQSVREPDRAVDLSRDGLAAGALAARLSADPSVGQRLGAFQTSQETLGGDGGTSFGHRSMALGYWTDNGSKPGFGLLGKSIPFSVGTAKARAPHKRPQLPPSRRMTKRVLR